MHFHGNATTALIRKLFFKGTRHFAHKPRVRAVMAAVTLLALAPFAWLANFSSRSQGREQICLRLDDRGPALHGEKEAQKPTCGPNRANRAARPSVGSQTATHGRVGSNCGLMQASTRAKRKHRERNSAGRSWGRGALLPCELWGPLTRQSGSQSTRARGRINGRGAPRHRAFWRPYGSDLQELH